MRNICIEYTTKPKNKPSSTDLGFGTVFTDHMFIMEYTPNEGWNNPRIVPYGPLLMDPSFMVLHYGQETFEGLKAYRGTNDEVYLFRPEMNGKRLNQSNKRLCIPEVPLELFLDGIKQLVKIDKDWIPKEEGTSLYIRPFVFATEPSLMVHPSHKYTFMVILSPVGAYYKEGINPVKIYVETEYVRASVGGVGFAKTGGNYGASLLAQEEAKKKGYAQVLWLDSKEHEFIEEVGTMNVFFVMNGSLLTPELSGSILPGVTRDSVLCIAEKMGLKAEVRKISIHEILAGIKSGVVTEAFGSGTAAVISPIGELSYKQESFYVGNGVIGPIASQIYQILTGIQKGDVEEDYGFRMLVE